MGASAWGYPQASMRCEMWEMERGEGENLSSAETVNVLVEDQLGHSKYAGQRPARVH